MNESGFIRAIHAKLPPDLYRWKVSDRFSAGVADAYYSSKQGDFWVEYKFYPKGLPKLVKPKLSKLQIRWLNERCNEGRSVYVAVGSPTHVLIYKNKEWVNTKASAKAMARDNYIEWLTYDQNQRNLAVS